MDKLIACTSENPCTMTAVAVDPHPARLMLFGAVFIGIGLLITLAGLIWQYRVNRGL